MSQDDFYPLDSFCYVITVYTSSNRFQSERFSLSLRLRLPLLYSFEVTHHPTGLFLAAGPPLGSHFTFIIKVMLRLPFSPSLPLSLSTDNKSCSALPCAASHYRRHVTLCALITWCSRRRRPRVTIHIHIKCLIREEVQHWRGLCHTRHQSNIVQSSLSSSVKTPSGNSRGRPPPYEPINRSRLWRKQLVAERLPV